MQISARATPRWSFRSTLRRFSLTLQARTLRCARLLSRAKVAPGPSTMDVETARDSHGGEGSKT